LSDFSLLDLLISVFGEIDDSKIINIKKHIDQLILKDASLENIDFLIRSEKSIKNLCTRNIACHFETFFPNTFNELISRVRKTYTKAKDFNSDEEYAFKSFCKYLAIARDHNKIIFHLIDYTECFNIALKSKNLEIAKFIVILLRYYVIVWSDFKNVMWTQKEHLTDDRRAECSKKAHDALNKFNRNLFLQFEYIFEKENNLSEIVMFLMDIKQLDKLKSDQNEKEFLEYDLGRYNSNKFDSKEFDELKSDQNEKEFLEYDLDRYNSKQKDPTWRIETTEDGEERKEFLFYLWQLTRDNDEYLKHESVKQIFNEKWREKAAIKYYFGLLIFIVYVVFYNIYMELDGKSEVNTAFQLSVWCISLILAVINLILEVFQCIMHIYNRKFIQYANRYVIKIEWLFSKVN